jgi:putative phosphoribosyl transferase
MEFRDRADAGRALAARLDHLRGEDIVVLGLPRGGVPVAAEVAAALEAPLDVIVVRKLGAPMQTELAMGAIGEGGILVRNEDVLAVAGISDAELDAAERRERRTLDERAAALRGDGPPVPLAGKTVVVVDDGIATGSTARAACLVARARGAARVVLAVPVAPASSLKSFASVADEVVCVDAPVQFFAVGQWYEDFSQTSDREVRELLRRAASRQSAAAGPSASDVSPPGDVAMAAHAGGAGLSPVEGLSAAAGLATERPAGGSAGDGGVPSNEAGDDAGGSARDVEVWAGWVRVAGRLQVPSDAVGIVVFAHGSGSGRLSPRNRAVADVLAEVGLGTLLFDLLTTEEERRRTEVFDIGLLASRLAAVTRWVRSQPEAVGLRLGYFGASTGAGAALAAAAQPGADIAAVVSRGGRPDLAGAALAAVRAPTLLIVGSRDPHVLQLNRDAQARMRCETRLAVVSGASHLFEEPGTLAEAAGLARDWFARHLGRSAPRLTAEG